MKLKSKYKSILMIFYNFGKPFISIESPLQKQRRIKSHHHNFQRDVLMNLSDFLSSPQAKSFFKFRDKYVTFYQHVFFQESFTNYLVLSL